MSGGVPPAKTDFDRSAGKRWEGLDVARALAVLAMVFVNFRTSLTLPEADRGWPGWLNTRLDGRASATFVILAGIGMALMARRAREARDAAALNRVRKTILARSLFLFFVGLLYWTIWPADILHYYGVYLAIGAFLLTASHSTLLSMAVALVATSATLLVSGVDYSARWDWEKLAYTGFWTSGGFLRNLLYNGFHPVIPWMAFLLLGMSLGRLDLTNAAIRRKLLLAGFACAASAEILSRILVRLASAEIGPGDAFAVFGTSPMPPMPLYMAAAAGTSVVVIVLCLSVADRHGGAAWLKPLVATGQLALTLYVAHVVLGIVPLAMARESTGPLSVVTSNVAAVAFDVCAVIFSALWRGRFARGPLELAMRRVTDRTSAA